MLTWIGLVPVVAAPIQFPADFVGSWKGTMTWTKVGDAKPTKVAMGLDIQKLAGADTYSYRLTYGDKGKDSRPYVLKAIDKAAGHWQVDENNGIVLDEFWVGERLVGVFSVGNSTIMSHLYRVGADLVSEMTTYETAVFKASGGKSEGIPSVLTNRILSTQRAVLSRR